MSTLYEFGAYRLDPQKRLVTRRGEAVPLAPKTFDLLLLLVESQGRARSKSELMRSLWPDTFVEEANLSFQVSTLRKALGEEGAKWIETLPKHGYRFGCDVVQSTLLGGSETSATAEKPRVSGQTNDSRQPASRKRQWALGAAIAAVVALVGALWLIRVPAREVSLDSRELPNEAVRPIPLTAYVGVEQHAAFSPDGSQVAFSWNGPDQDNEDIYVQVIGSGSALRLTTDPAPDRQPGWSPDGRQIAFVRTTGVGNSEVRLISPLGGPERRLAEISAPQSQFDGALSWSPDGKSLAISEYEGSAVAQVVTLLSLDSGEKRPLTTPPRGAGDRSPAFSPDGGMIVFDRNLGWRASEIYLLPLPQGEPRRLASVDDNAYGLAWTPDGREIVFGTSDGLWRTPLTGESPQRVEGTNDFDTQPAISRLGDHLAFTRQESHVDIWRLDLKASKGTLPSKFISSTRNENGPAFSPDGNQIAFTSNRSGTYEIWVCDKDGSNPLQITSLGASTGSPSWSPDGSLIAFDAAIGGNNDIFVVGASGGEPRQVTDSPYEDSLPSWSSDGRRIYFSSNRSGEQQIWAKRVDSDGDEDLIAVQVTQQGGLRPRTSNGGAFIYYTKRLAGQSPSIWRRPLGGGEEEEVIGPPVHSHRWALTDGGIYFVAQDLTGPPSGSWKLRFHSFDNDQITDVATLHYTPDDRGPGLAVSPDDRWVLGAQVEITSDLMLVEDFR